MSPARADTTPTDLSVPDAIERLTSRLEPLASEQLALSGALGRVLAKDIALDRPSPPAAVSAMDGYAVRIRDATPGKLSVRGEVLPGARPPDLPHGAALRIFTGAPIPRDADTVIPRELVDEHHDAIVVTQPLDLVAGRHIRWAGENAEAGEVVVHSGITLTAPRAGAAASCGAAMVSVHRRVRIAILATGPELRASDEPVDPWHIRDSNTPALSAMLGRPAWTEVTGAHRVADDLDATAAALERALSDNDAVFITGGVSAGDYDCVPDAVRACGGEIAFHRLPIRPGKPVLASVAPSNRLIFGLPGNPLSAMVTARRLAASPLRRLAGFRLVDPPPRELDVSSCAGSEKTIALTWYRLVRATGNRGELVPTKGSGDIVSAARSDGFVEVPPGQAGHARHPFYTWAIAEEVS